MTRKELERVRVISAVSEKHLTQRAAALRLGLCVRQVKNLVRRYREQDEAGLISGHRGQLLIYNPHIEESDHVDTYQRDCRL